MSNDFQFVEQFAGFNQAGLCNQMRASCVELRNKRARNRPSEEIDLGSRMRCTYYLLYTRTSGLERERFPLTCPRFDCGTIYSESWPGCSSFRYW